MRMFVGYRVQYNDVPLASPLLCRVTAFHNVHEMAEEYGTDARIAVYMVAVQRATEVIRLRG